MNSKLLEMNLYKMIFKKTEEIVKDVLIKFPETRSDDFLLIFAVYREINFNLAIMDRFSEVMINHSRYKLPSFHTITRARRKIFEKYPELRPEKVTRKRKELEEDYKEYART